MGLLMTDSVKSVQMRSFFWSVFSRIWTEYGEIRSISPNAGKYGPEKTPYRDIFHVVRGKQLSFATFSCLSSDIFIISDHKGRFEYKATRNISHHEFAIIFWLL